VTGLPEVAGSGPAERRAMVVAELEAIVDPCSRALGKPIGLAGMGMIERLDVSGDAVSVLLLPTFPACIFRGVFEAEIEKRLLALPWCDSVSVAFCPAEQSWDESRMSAAARARLGRRDRDRRAAPAGAPRR
jgi:metal-sulfur cluster biosynthetic enzyme